MKRLIFPGPYWILIAIVVAACSGMTECRYENIAAWQGNCSPKEVHADNIGHAHLSLSCPGFPYSPPFTDNGVAISRMAKGAMPQSFWCSVTRSGDSSCILPKNAEK